MPSKPGNSPVSLVGSTNRPTLDPRYHLAAIVDSSDDPIISKGLDGTIVSWNPAATRVFGYLAEEIVGGSILTLVPPELHEEEYEILAKLRNGERIEHFETTRLRKNGERFPISVTISPVKDANGTVVGASKIGRDISEQKKADETRLRLAAIVDSADDAIIGKDLHGIVKSWNGAAERMFGYTAREMVGSPILRLIPEDLQYEEEQILTRLRAGERIEHYETTRRKKNGDLFEVSVTISPITDESNRVIGASKIARDISDRKRVERVLLQSEKLAATGRMAATIAHEINNPLESLMNLVYLARNNSDPASEAHGFLLTAEQELERVSHIARQTLGFYQDTGLAKDIYLHDVIDNVLRVYGSRLLGGGVKTETRYTDMQKILVNEGEMVQVFSNLVANASDAMRQGGTLHIGIRKLLTGPGGLQVVVKDTGCGIDQANLPKVFEPFFTTKGNLGTGVGLWVTKQLVERRGGQISIASSTASPNAGTTVTIFLPFAVPASTAATGQQPTD
ncbi:MAG: PAS domain S-box protein [Acidobacteriota bacterium]|nr:PAS domain S-box protein [Acidobacteriota bacterium]